MGNGRVMVVDGCRTPFLRSGTEFAEMSALDLACAAVAGLLHRTAVDPGAVDLLVMGTVIQDPATSNLGRETVLGTALPPSCPAHTVTMACVSSLQAVLAGIHAILAGDARVVIAAGTETFSDVPIRYRRAVRRRLLAAQRARGWRDYLALLHGLRLADLRPDPPAIAEFSTGESMGANCERLAKRWGIDRESQDAYALGSHRRAAAATEAGLLARQVVPVHAPPAMARVARDNGIRADSTPERLAALLPAFDRRLGTVTAGNASFLTDGAAAVLLADEGSCRRLGLEPLASVRGWAVSGADPREELLLGPAFTIPRALDRAGLSLAQVDVIELHEAFAAQVLAIERALADRDFCRERLGRTEAVGPVDPERLNAWGGSLAVGHPFGATGARLLTTCAHRLAGERGRVGLVAACAAGALGHALVVERP